MNTITERQYQGICSCLPIPLAEPLLKLHDSQKAATQEIRLRTAQPLSIFDGKRVSFLSTGGSIVSPVQGIAVTQELLREALIGLCGYSLHSHSAELENGYVTAVGGCRVGVVMDSDAAADHGVPIALNIRIAKGIDGAAQEIIPTWNKADGLILAGPPGCGKTTILRDMAATISLQSRKLTVIDERREISGICSGVPAFELGPCTDIIVGMKKAEAIRRAIRTLSPCVILCDEVAGEDEVAEIRAALSCGVKFLVTVHCGRKDELYTSPVIRSLFATGAFSHLLLLPPDPAGSGIPYLMEKEAYRNEVARHIDGV